MNDDRSAPIRRFQRLAWTTIAVNLVVILWGAWVRASGSGDGCGKHWPLCHGEAFPLAAEVATLIEFTHRLTSGMALLLVVLLVYRARAIFPAGHRVRTAAWASLVFIVIEALLGAGLVLFGLVADDSSMTRAIVLGAHLVNTQILLAWLMLTAWWSGVPVPAGPPAPIGRFVAVAVALLAVGATGAIASLATTLFPAETLASGIAQDLDPTSHLLLRLRFLHPVAAIATGLVAWSIASAEWRRRHSEASTRFSRLVTVLVVIQWTLGFGALLLLAPVPMQLAHLLTADLLWMSWVALAAVVRDRRPQPA